MKSRTIVLVLIALMMCVSVVQAAGITGQSNGVGVSKNFLGKTELTIPMKDMRNYDFGSNVLAMTNKTVIRFYDLTTYNKPVLVKQYNKGAYVIGRFFGKLYVTDLKTVWAYTVSSPKSIALYSPKYNMGYISGSNVNICDQFGTVKYTYNWPENKRSMVIKNNIAYVPVGNLIKIIDISNAAKPSIISSIKPGANCIDATDNYLFIGEVRGVTVIDISTPAKPKVVSNYLSPNGKAVTTIETQDNYLAIYCGAPYGYKIGADGKLTKV